MLDLALESDERSIYRNTLKKFLVRKKKRSAALDQYGSTRTIFHFLSHKTTFHNQALLHMFVLKTRGGGNEAEALRGENV